jgi:hypothetical protein
MHFSAGAVPLASRASRVGAGAVRRGAAAESHVSLCEHGRFELVRVERQFS